MRGISNTFQLTSTKKYLFRTEQSGTGVKLTINCKSNT
jgi:hypothetical protein